MPRAKGQRSGCLCGDLATVLTSFCPVGGLLFCFMSLVCNQSGYPNQDQAAQHRVSVPTKYFMRMPGGGERLNSQQAPPASTPRLLNSTRGQKWG